MKLLFVLNNGDAKYMEYEHTGILNSPNRRSVEIDLTPEQIHLVRPNVICQDRGRVITETIESVSIIEVSK